MAIVTGMNNIWISTNKSKITPQVDFCSHLCKQYLFSPHQRELRHDKQRLHYSFNGNHCMIRGTYVKKIKIKIQKYSNILTTLFQLMSWSVHIVQELPPSKPSNPFSTQHWNIRQYLFTLTNVGPHLQTRICKKSIQSPLFVPVWPAV